jgi:biopolymer transport protein ExbB/TolQ
MEVAQIQEQIGAEMRSIADPLEQADAATATLREELDRRGRARRAQYELKEINWQIKNIDACIDQLKHNRELAVMRRDVLLKTISENQPV